MWMLDLLYNALPDGWLVYQEFMLADASTFLSYNANMRQLMADKLQSCEVIVFNRYNDKISKEELHKIVRGSSRKAAIGFEYEDGSFEQDTIEDPLPYDLDADVVVIKDTDFAVFYRDLSEEMEKYNGKTIRFKGIVARDPKMPDTCVLAGRHVMTCCADDIAFHPLVCIFKEPTSLKTRDWVTLTGKIKVEKHKLYNENKSNWGKMGERFSTSSDCNLCGKCVKNCPVGNISVTDGKISFGNKCTCFGTC
jgi:hypothetical protein